MSYQWYGLGAPNSVSVLENATQNGSLTHSPAALTGGTESPGTSAHLPTAAAVAAAAGGFPSSPFSIGAPTSQHSSDTHSQSPVLSHASPAGTYLPSFSAENMFQQHLYSSHNRFAPFGSDGSSADQNFSPFGMSSAQSLSQSFAMRSQPYMGMPGYGDSSSQQDMSRLNAYGTSPYGTPSFDNYYSPFDGRGMPGASQGAESQLMSMKADPFENGVPRPSANPWQFTADGRDGLYPGSGYGLSMSPYSSPLAPMFHSNSHYRPVNYDSPHMPPHFSVKPEMPDPYAISASGMGPRFSPPQMMYGSLDKSKSPKKKERSPTPKPPSLVGSNPDDSPSVPNKASRYFSDRGIFVFVPPDTGQSIGPYPGMPMISIADRYILCQKALCQRLADVDLPPKVTYVYNPLEYAFETHYKFVKKYYNSTKRILFLGMNPGPFGMSQNGVPFGECNIVTDWMNIDGEVLKPVLEHPKRPVMGMECKRSEVSGARFWELFRRLCPTAESFFNNCAIHNLCPLAFMTETGKNVAPSDMPVKVLRQLDSLCDTTFLEVVNLFKIEHVITVGKYAYTCAQKAMTAANITHVQLHCMMHPSPANPSANKGWADIAEGQLREFGVYNIIAVNPQPPPQQQQQQQQQQAQRQQMQQQPLPHHPQHQPAPPHQGMHPHPHPSANPHMNPHPHANPHGLHPNPYHSQNAHPHPHPHAHPHMGPMHPLSHHNNPHHHPHPHSQHYPVPHVLQSTGGVNPVPVGMGIAGDHHHMMGDGKRTHDGMENSANQKRLKREET